MTVSTILWPLLRCFFSFIVNSGLTFSTLFIFAATWLHTILVNIIKHIDFNFAISKFSLCESFTGAITTQYDSNILHNSKKMPMEITVNRMLKLYPVSIWLSICWLLVTGIKKSAHIFYACIMKPVLQSFATFSLVPCIWYVYNYQMQMCNIHLQYFFYNFLL